MSYACGLYVGGGKKPVLEELAVVPSDVEQTHTPSYGSDGFSKVIVQPVPLTTLEVTPGPSWQRFTPESPAIGYSRVDVNGAKYDYNRRNDYPDATSSYELSVKGFGGITGIDGIKNIHISLFNYDNQTGRKKCPPQYPSLCLSTVSLQLTEGPFLPHRSEI